MEKIEKKWKRVGEKREEILAGFRSPTYSSQRTTNGDFLTFSRSLNPSRLLLSSQPRPPFLDLPTGPLWAWSLLPPRGPPRYCQMERWQRRTSHHREDQFGGDTGCRLSERGSTKTQGWWRTAATSWKRSRRWVGAGSHLVPW